MKEEVQDLLTANQERFCINYTQNYELFGNATLSYAEAFDFDLESQPTNDAQYRFEDGTIYAEYELEDIDIKSEYHISKGKKIQDSSYKRMYDNVSTYASKLRRNLKIQSRCRDLLNEFMNDKVIDARLTEIILDGDSTASIQAIKEYNKLRQRIIDRKDITTDGKPITITFDSAFNKKPNE